MALTFQAPMSASISMAAVEPEQREDLISALHIKHLVIFGRTGVRPITKEDVERELVCRNALRILRKKGCV